MTHASLFSHRHSTLDLLTHCNVPRPILQGAAKGASDVNKFVPVHVYGPPGLASFIHNSMMFSDTTLFMPVFVFELCNTTVPQEEQQPQRINARAKLFRVRCCLSPPEKESSLSCGTFRIFLLWQHNAETHKAVCKTIRYGCLATSVAVHGAQCHRSTAILLTSIACRCGCRQTT